jgi:hypothetical protein
MAMDGRVVTNDAALIVDAAVGGLSAASKSRPTKRV